MYPTIKKLNVSIEIKFNGKNTKIKFPFKNDTPELRNVRIWGLQTYYGDKNVLYGNFSNDITYLKPLIDQKEFQNCYITLYDRKNVNFVKDAPVVIFQTIQGNSEVRNIEITERDNKTFCGQILDLQNSYIEFTADVNNIVNDSPLIFNCDIYYSKLDEKVPFLKN
jgi:hypothetical protein